MHDFCAGWRVHIPILVPVMRINPSIVILVSLVGATAVADEGMWLPEQLPALSPVLAERGLEIDPASLSDLTTHPMSAIISLGGCSASFVSATGLVITNHHCAVGALQQNSTAEVNYLADGFNADTLQDEVYAGPGSRVYVTVSMEDVTDALSTAFFTGGSTHTERYSAYDRASKMLVEECEADGSVKCTVAAYDGGASFRLLRQMEIQDVRLVYAPPASIGYYGGEVDNWMWPRHTGDFAFFRAYVSPDGAPVPYDEANVPYEPTSFLEVNGDGVDDGSFVMVAGYPGRTFRYRTYEELLHARDVSYPWQIATMNDLMGILETRMEGDPEAAVRLGTLYFGLSNYKKNNEGMLDGFANSDGVERAGARDALMSEWVDELENPDEQARWYDALAALDALIEEGRATEQRDRLLGWMGWTVRLAGAVNTTYFLAQERELDDDLQREAGYQERDWPNVAEGIRRVERSYDPVADERIFAYFLRAADQLEQGVRIDFIDALLGDCAVERTCTDARYDAVAATVIGGTAMRDQSTREQTLEWTAADFESSADPLVQLAVAAMPMRREILARDRERSGAMMMYRPQYMHVLRMAMAGTELYPDANSTLRVTFGNVRGYTDRAGAEQQPFTTADGVAEKHTGEDPFDAPQPLLDAIAGYEGSPFGLNGPESQVPVAFLSNLDTTGGNSGSATLDSMGRLVGLLFDGNYESMASDWVFEVAVTRSIHADIRYVLWLMSDVYPAPRLIEEMHVVGLPAAEPAPTPEEPASEGGRQRRRGRAE
jgi:hypothetical protein